MRIILIFMTVLFWSCRKDHNTAIELTAQNIIDRTIDVSGGEKFTNSTIGFQFRDAYYAASRTNGSFSYSRIRQQGNDSIIDILSNDGFARFINNEFQKIPDSLGLKYSASVNSVHYFSVLPYGLNDFAVRKKLLEPEIIKGHDYYKIEVSFEANGGGEDYEDLYIYWISKLDFKVHYMAYSYAEDDGAGMRFRAAYNERYIGGLRFVDYKNFKPKSNRVGLRDLAKQYNQGNLDLVSNIGLEQISVKLINLE